MRSLVFLLCGFLLWSQGQAQNLYGTSFAGGSNNKGVLYHYNFSTSTFTKKMDFDSTATGSHPSSAPIQASDGKLYGVTTLGGTFNKGVLYQYDPSTSVFTKKADFDSVATGANPTGHLVQATNGKLYGVTPFGGTNGKGAIFEYDPVASVLVKKFNFSGTANGEYPTGSLVAGNNGLLYGMTSEGGSSDKGVIFMFNPSTSAVAVMVHFNGVGNGAEPHGSLTKGSGGTFYGMTSKGGANNMGVLFQYDPSTMVFLKRLDFNGSARGSEPYGSLIQATDGHLYGLTSNGGSNGSGVLFQYNLGTSTFTKKIDFNGSARGATPIGSLIQASNGSLYGMTTLGGANNLGVLFQYNNPTSTFTKKLDFSPSTHGSLPVEIIEAVTIPFSITNTVTTTQCAGNAINVRYTATGLFNGSNVFTAQLSNASGSFSSPVAIGTLSSTTSGTINATIPAGAASGSGYRIRVVSSSPSVTGSNNGTNITINAAPVISASASSTNICPGVSVTLSASGANTYTWNPGNVTGSQAVVNPSSTTTYTVAGTNASGCIGQKTIPIQVNSLPTLTPSANPGAICPGATSTLSATGANTYTWQPGNLSGSVTIVSPATTITYTVRGAGAAGCIGQTTISVQVEPLPVIIVAAGPGTICSGASSTLSASGANTYTWQPGDLNGSAVVVSPTMSMIYSVSGTNASGCSNSATLSLVVKNGGSSTSTISTCNSYEWNAVTYTASGIYTYTTQNSAGCDSTAVLNLTINHSSNSTSSVSACNNYVWHATTYTTSGIYTYTTQNSTGCDSVAVLNLTINRSSNSTSTVTACNSYEWNAATYTTSGIYTYTTQNSTGCDSAAVLNLTINHSSNSTSSVSACNNYVWNATTYTTSGIYTYTTQNSTGCDSTAILNLTINNSSNSTSSVSACNNYVWHATTYTTSGVYTYTTQNAAGCDSVAVLNLTINHSSNSTSTVTACNSYEWNAATYTTSGIYTYTTQNSTGCDSTAVLNLTINHSSNSTSSVSACNNYVWNATTYTTSGVYTYTIQNPTGCDSTAILNLTINHSTNSSSTVTACNSYEWNATTYTTSGVYTYTTQNAAGCDSVAVLNLTINHSTNSSSTVTACNSYEWNAVTYTASGVYTYTTQNSTGCDSTAVLNLTINQSSSSSSTVNVCNSYVWNGNTYTVSGVYTYTTLNAKGCDSTAVLHLAIGNTSSSSTVSACDSYAWNSTTYTTSGVYTYSTQNASGCDSIASLVLTIHTSPQAPVISPSGTQTFCPTNPLLLSGPANMGAYLWSNGAATQTLSVTNSGAYSLQVTDIHGCISPYSSAVLMANGMSSDFNDDGTVDIDDFLLFAPKFGFNCTCREDLNQDGKVDIDDFLLFAPVFATSCH